MPDAKIPPVADSNGRAWNQDVIYSVLNHPFRRHLLLSLAQKGPLPARQLGGRRLGTTLKHLVLMIEAELVMKCPNPNDGRQPIYALTPAVPVVKTDSGVQLDFGFCIVRL